MSLVTASPVVMLACAIAAAAVASSKARSWLIWSVLGFFLAPLGLIIVALLPAASQVDMKAAQKYGVSGDYRKCPFCAEPIRKEANKCRFCGSEVNPIA